MYTSAQSDHFHFPSDNMPLLSFFIVLSCRRISSDAHLLGFRIPPLSLGLQHERFCLGGRQEHEELWDTSGRLSGCVCVSIKLFCVCCFSGELFLCCFFAGRPVEWHWLHGPVHGLHLWLVKVCNAAWHGQGPARSWPALRHDPGTHEFVLAFICVSVRCSLCVWLLFLNLQDPGISSTQPEGTYWPFDEGLRRQVFIKDAEGRTLIGKVRHVRIFQWPVTFHKLLIWDNSVHCVLVLEGNIYGELEVKFSILSSRCGPVWQHILISLMQWRMSGGTTT